MINGVEIKKLVIHKDKRGFFCELIKSSDPFFKNSNFAQLSHSFCKKGVLKAWHLHKKQTDFIYVVSGNIKLVLYDTRQHSKTYKKLVEIYLGEKREQIVVKIPPGVAHGYKIINGFAHIVYLMDREYNSNDELRISHNDPEIKYNWNK